jgi:CheY-like chemotaxis protein
MASPIKKIIVCDDQTIFRELTASYLQLKGWEVLRASTGEECVELALSEDNVEAILLDIQMPGIGGIETLKKLRSLGIGAEIILMTGFALGTKEAISTGQDSVNTLLLKPFDLRGLHELLVKAGAKGDKAMQEKQRVLVVDDEELLRNMLAMFLKKNGFDVVCAKDGQECIALAEEESFLAILMDIRMPNLDGVAVLRTLRSKNINTPVVLMSGYCDLESVDEAKEQGAQGFLSKPFTPTKAVEMLKQEIALSNK